MPSDDWAEGYECCSHPSRSIGSGLGSLKFSVARNAQAVAHGVASAAMGSPQLAEKQRRYRLRQRHPLRGVSRWCAPDGSTSAILGAAISSRRR